MADRMWSLSEFRVDDAIPGDEVVLQRAGEEAELLPKAAAIDRATASGMHLYAEWPAEMDGEPLSCIIGMVGLPLRWERHDDESVATDERLWFVGPCGGRDILVEDGGWTFLGRMTAWCPRSERTYKVSKSEMGEMSTESEYFVRGFLCGRGPEPFVDDDDNSIPEDFDAWRAATGRFRRTGDWVARWRTCDECGRVLLPDSGGARCESH